MVRPAVRVAFAEQLAGGGTDVRAAPVRHRRSLPGGAFPYGRNSGEDIPVHVLIVYGTSKGQTYKLACVPAARMVRNAHRVLTAGCSNASVLPDPDTFDAVLLAASYTRGATRAQ